MFAFSKVAVRALLILNLVAGLLLLAFLIFTLVRPELFASRLGEGVLNHLRFALLLILPVTAAVHLISRQLLAMLETAGLGDPFVSANGARLQRIGWALLVIQLCDLAFGIAVGRIEAMRGELVSGWSPSVTGWLAVLLVFVLARIFEQGARMRDDLELTV